MKKILNENLFQTNSLNLAAALHCCGFKLEKFDKTIPSKTIFFFSNSPKLEKTKENFLIGNLEVDARTYIASIKELKSIIYENL